MTFYKCRACGHYSHHRSDFTGIGVKRCRDRVASRFDVSVEQLCGKGQSRALSRARKMLAKLCQQQGLKGSEIGNFLGRTRAAVSYMVLSLDKELAKTPELRERFEELQ